MLALDGSNWQRVDLFLFQRDVTVSPFLFVIYVSCFIVSCLPCFDSDLSLGFCLEEISFMVTVTSRFSGLGDLPCLCVCMNNNTSTCIIW